MPGTVYACSRLKKPRDISGNLIMSVHDSECGWKKKSLRLSLWAVLMLLAYAQFGTIVNAEDFWPLNDNPLSPLSYFPLLRGEAKCSLFVPTLRSGYFENTNGSRDLKSFYNIEGGDSVFLDLMVRFQLGRFSSRTYYEWREFFAGHHAARDAALDYSGLSEGLDVDIFLGNKSRVGFNIDCSFYGPKFSAYGTDNTTITRVTGPQYSWTIGIHGLYNPVWNLFGVSAVAEGWARWPIGGTLVTDYEVSGGLKSPDTVLGRVFFGSSWLSFYLDKLLGTISGEC